MQQRLYKNSDEADQEKGLILYFNGWAMTPEAVEHLLLPEGFDLLVCWDYRDLSFDFDFTPYNEIHLVAWSMGVWAAEQLDARHLLPALASATAVCGTAFPMDDEMGIPVAIFKGTWAGLNEANRLRFNRRMCGGKSLKTLFDALAARPTDEIKAELQCVMQSEEQRLLGALSLATQPLKWDRAYIGMKDLVIPPENQLRFWRMRGAELCVLSEQAHYLFNDYRQWGEILKINR